VAHDKVKVAGKQPPFREIVMKLVSSMVIAVALLGAVSIAQADSTKETTPPPKAAATLASAQQRLDAGDYRGAIPILTDVIKADPNNPDALNLMGFSLRNTGQTDLALQYYTKALALMPKHLGANEYLGELYVELSQMDKAKERLAVLVAACGNCDQEVHLAAAIAKGPGTKAGTWR
jgi:Tfp pilus assembly protein PilF